MPTVKIKIEIYEDNFNQKVFRDSYEHHINPLHIPIWAECVMFTYKEYEKILKTKLDDIVKKCQSNQTKFIKKYKKWEINKDKKINNWLKTNNLPSTGINQLKAIDELKIIKSFPFSNNKT